MQSIVSSIMSHCAIMDILIYDLTFQCQIIRHSKYFLLFFYCTKSNRLNPIAFNKVKHDLTQPLDERLVALVGYHEILHVIQFQFGFLRVQR